ncbi:MAG TPA: hypothetical protein VHB20_12065 [Verrucomicrobiae bacterium]|nr:hypothetical protein [Verrucomicrobiae bacterium]
MNVQKTILALIAGAALSGQAQTFRHITIDGDTSDWNGIAPSYSDPQDSTNSLDYRDIYVANDEDYLYIRFTIYPSANATYMNQQLSYNNLFIDTDNNYYTGFIAGGQIGSELLIQGSSGYQEVTGVFNAGSIDNLGYAFAPTPDGVASDFEVRISRHALNHSDGSPVFASPQIALMYEAETTTYSTVELAPDYGAYPPLVYTFAPTPGTFSGTANLLAVSDPWQVNDSGADLGTNWSSPGYDDTQSGWSTGQGLFGYTTQPGAYPPIQKSLATGKNTYYFRTHFQWNYDSSGAAYVVTNYLSDGAVYYLNGTEIHRDRMPSGAVTAATAATGTNSPAGAPDVFGLPASMVYPGDNVLAVETHQAPASASDMVFGLSLTAESQFPPIIVDPSQPVDRTVVSGGSTTFSAEALGEPINYQWLKNGAPISSATNATFTINPVMSADAGSYALQVSSATGTNTSRAAVLTVTLTPVSIDDPTQPANLTLVQGTTANFSVAASGSELRYQWFDGTSLIQDATNASYSIAAVAASDDGSYHVVVSNNVSSQTSRSAVLNVLVDTTPPTIVSAAASPNQVIITFSEPVDPVTASHAANYHVSGLTVLSATVDTNDATRVILATSAQTLGSAYVLSVSGVQDRFNNAIAPNSQAAFNSSIIIDGSFDDWAGIAPVYSGPPGSTSATDFKDVYIYNDADYIYFRLTTWEPTTFMVYYNNIFNDGDGNTNSGYISGVGSEMLIQDGNGYQEKNGAFNEGGINDLGWLSAPDTGTNFEFRISRHATYATDNGLVFTTNTVHFVFDGETTSYASVNRAPAVGTIAYTIVEPQALPLGALSVSPGAGSISVSWLGAGTLQSRGSLTSGSWTNVTGNPNPYTTPTTGTQQYFRLTK